MANVTVVLICAALAGLLVMREVSSRRALARLKKELAATQAQVSDREQLANVGQVVSGLAQELKSPLQGVIGNTELMLASVDRSHVDTEDLREIRESATRAAGIVRNLLAFTEPSPLSRRWYDVNEIVARAVARCRGELEMAGVRVQVVRADRLPLVYVDGRQLEKVIATLLARPVPVAAMAPPDDGRAVSAVTIETRRGPDPDDQLVIELDDRMAESGENDVSWSGDLAACRRVVEAHAGSLEVERRDGGGFRFHLELPVAAAGVETVPGGQE